jgi:tetratricopeptide (TPR) repeat protein
VIKARANQPGGQPAEPTSALPDWLKDLDKPAPPPPAAEPMEEASAESDLPDWLKEPVKPAAQASVTPAPVEPAPEGALPSWMDETMIMHKPPVPTTPGEWVPADAAGEPGAGGAAGSAPAQGAEAGSSAEPVVEPVATAVPSVVHLARSSGTGMLSNIPTQDKDGKLLMAAQVELDNNNLNEAMKTYLSLIKKGKLLEEVIHDLREALYRYPVDIIVWQTLGDAYMRTNQLQDALDAYTKAEELLR